MREQVFRIGELSLLPIVLAVLIAAAPNARGDDGWGPLKEQSGKESLRKFASCSDAISCIEERRCF